MLDAALLVETGLHRELCGAILHVDAPPELRRRRACVNGEMPPDQFEKRSRAQINPEQKRLLADHTINNAGSREELAQQIEDLWPELVSAG